MKVVELRQIMKKNGQDLKGATGRKGARGGKGAGKTEVESKEKKESTSDIPIEVWTLTAEWGYDGDDFHNDQDQEKWMVGTFSSRMKAISNVDMVMEKITGVGKEWKELFDIDDKICKGGEGVILTAEGDDDPTYTIKLHKTILDQVQVKA